MSRFPQCLGNSCPPESGQFFFKRMRTRNFISVAYLFLFSMPLGSPAKAAFLKKLDNRFSMAVASLESSYFAPAPAPIHREPGKSVEISPNGCSHAPFLPVFPKEKGQEAQAARPVLDSFRDFSGMRDFPGRAFRPCLSRRLVVSCP